MAKHAECEQNQAIELTADEMEHVAGGLKFEMVDVKITSTPQSGHDTSPVPAN